VFYFENNGDPELFCSSADWMERNFFRRVEIAFPIKREAHRERILRDLGLYLADNVQAWCLGSDAAYTRQKPAENAPSNAQDSLLEKYAAGPGFSL
jgi:polyphosphate kinase